MLPEVAALIAHYGLTPLPVEATLFASTYRSAAAMPDGGPVGTAIVGLYCDEPYSVSLFHKLSVDEVWHFYGGDPLRLVLLYPDGTSRDVILGSSPLAGQHVQFVVPAGVWQAGHMVQGSRYSLYGCTTVPGFTSASFKGGTKSALLAQYPERVDDIARLGIEDAHESEMPPDSG